MTLFVANLPPATTAASLESFFGDQVGYSSCRLRCDRAGQSVGFAEFRTEAAAMGAMERLQGHKVNASDDRGVTIALSKNPSGSRGPSKSVQPPRAVPRMPVRGVGPPGVASTGNSMGMPPMQMQMRTVLEVC